MISFIKRMFASMTEGEREAKVQELRAANKVLRPTVNFAKMADMFYRRKAKLKMWVPNRINGKVVIKTHSYLDIKRRFDPDHVKARLASATFKGVVGRLSWQEWAKKLVEDKPVVPLKKKILRKDDLPIFQPKTPRLRCRHVHVPYIRPRQVRKAKARAEAERQAALAS